MCPRLPDNRQFQSNSNNSNSTGSARSPTTVLSTSVTAATDRSAASSAPHTPAPLSSTEHLALDAFIDHLLTGGPTLAVSTSSLLHMNSTEAPASQNTLFGYPMPVDLFSALYAGTVASGGLIGYLKAGSKPSLAAGLLFGSLLGYGTYLTSVNPDNYYLTLGTSSVLGAVMGARFYKSGKFMPAGIVCAFSLAMVTRCFYRMISNQSNSK